MKGNAKFLEPMNNDDPASIFSVGNLYLVKVFFYEYYALIWSFVDIIGVPIIRAGKGPVIKKRKLQ
jgi:hypothetical protein